MITLLQQKMLSVVEFPFENKPIDIWLWVAILELVIIVVLLFVLLYKKSALHSRKSKILAEDPDFANVFDSAFNAAPLYKELSRKCHPDRFAPDPEKMRIADNLFRRITENKNNIKELHKLKEEISQKLEMRI